MKNLTKKLVVFFALALALANPAFAVPPAVLSDLTSGISFTDVGLAILAIALSLSAIAVTWIGARTVLRALGWKF